MQFLDKDMAKVKLEIEGVTYYFGNTYAMVKGIQEGGWAMVRNANYITENGKFTKNRSTNPELLNVILGLGRDEINELFDFMEGK